jgi:Putative beta-barrel porin-2, OmpL-like. bbp2
LFSATYARGFIKKSIVKRLAFPYFRFQLHDTCRAKQAFARCSQDNKQTTITKQHRRNQMKFNKWTVGLAAVGVVSLASAARADEQMSQVQTALTQTTLSGYVDTAAQYSPGTDYAPNRNDNGANIPGYAFAKDDGFSLNAVDIALDKPEDSSAWAAGYHVEMMYGADAVGVALGGVNPQSTIVGGRVYELDGGIINNQATIRQAFIRLHTPVGGNGIDWQVGVWDNIIGYESNSDPSNPNYTRSYGYTIEPTTMTGILGTYKVNDIISLSAGVAEDDGGLGGIPPISSGSFGSYESQKAYMGTVTLTAPDSMGFLKGGTASFGVVHGSASQAAGPGNTTSLYAGATIPTPMNQLKVGAAFDYLMENQDVTFNGTASHSDGDIWVAGVYGTFQATDKLSFDARAEYVSDYSNTGDIVHLYSNTMGAGLPKGNDAEELTFTAQYNLWANVISRAEFRWDHVEHTNPFGAQEGGTAGGYGSSYKNNDFLLALNLIYQF